MLMFPAISLAAAVAIIGLSALPNVPEHLACSGLDARLSASRFKEFVIERMYSVSSIMYKLIHGKYPDTFYDKLVQKVWWSSSSPSNHENVRQFIAHFTNKTYTEEERPTVDILERAAPIARTYKEIGFQTDEPWRDFRGTGFLGLQMLRLLSQDQTLFHKLLAESKSASDYSGACYPLALASIRVTMNMTTVFEEHPILAVQLEGYPYTTFHGLSLVHKELMQQFHELWKREVEANNVKTILDVEHVFSLFEKSQAKRVQLILESRAADLLVLSTQAMSKPAFNSDIATLNEEILL